MRLSERVARTLGCGWLTASTLLFLTQFMFLILKLAGVVAWSWLKVWTPGLILIATPFVVIFVALLTLVPKICVREWQAYDKVNAEAKRYGIERQPGETTSELKKRIVKRNMIAGDYSRKDIKDILLEKFPDLASVQFFVNNEDMRIVLNVRCAGNGYIKEEELVEILEEAKRYIPEQYTVRIIQRQEDK